MIRRFESRAARTPAIPAMLAPGGGSIVDTPLYRRLSGVPQDREREALPIDGGFTAG